MKLIALHGKKGEGMFIMVDNIDYERVNKYKWHYHANKGSTVVYARRTYIKGYRDVSKPKHGKNAIYGYISLHHFITGISYSIKIDHIDGNGLNNTRENLRIATDKQNQQNRGKYAKSSCIYKGVLRSKNITNSNKPWRAKITHDGKLESLGHYKTPEEGAVIYDLHAIKYFGEFARTNFPRENYEDLNIDEEIEKMKLTVKPRRKDNGIVWVESRKRWRVTVWLNHKSVYIGCYKIIEDAKKARKEAEEKYFK